MTELQNTTTGAGKRWFILVPTFFLYLCLACLAIWETLFLLFAPYPPLQGRVLAAAFVASLGLILLFRKRFFWAKYLGGLLLLLPLIYWFSLNPSNNRNWRKDLAVLPYATVEGNKVTIHNIRYCKYRTDKDYDVHYYTKTFDLSHLCCAYIILSDWGLHKVVHTMFSFGFRNGNKIDYVCFSIEVRKEKGEGYSAIRGFFKNYEIIYVVGDERDLIKLRTDYRKSPPEVVRMYKLNPPSRKVLRKVFMDFVRKVNHLKEHPEWYNELTSNCMTSAFFLMRPDASRIKSLDWRLILNGYADRLLYEKGVIDNSTPFEEVRRNAIINQRAKAAGNSSNFSKLIRQGVNQER